METAPQGATRERVDPVVRAMVLALPVAKLVGVLLVKPTTYPDSDSYRVPHTWFDFSLTSLDGRSLRPWGVTVWQALWPNETIMMWANALLSAGAWGALALVVAGRIRHAILRRLAVLALVLIPCTAQLANWDSVMLGETTSMSTGVLALAALIWFVRRPTLVAALVLSSAALWFAMCRPNNFVILLCWCAALVLVALTRRRSVATWAVAAAMVVISGYAYAYNVNTNQGWRDAYGYSKTTVAYAYPIGYYNPESGAILRALRKSDAPRCMIPPGNRLLSRGGPSLWVHNTVKTCPQMDAWATDHWQAWYLKWLATHPKGTVKIVMSQIRASLSPTVWGDITATTPDSVAQLFVGTPAQPQDVLKGKTFYTQPLVLWLLAVIALAISAARLRRWRGTLWEVDIALVASVVGGVLCAVSSVLLIQTMPFEVAQESMGATAVITAALVAAVGVGLDRLLRHPARSG